jgi:hypothetical protein
MAERANATPLAMLIGTAVIACISGYMIGIASSLGFIPIPFHANTAVPHKAHNYDNEEESAEEDIEESLLDHAPNWANGIEADKRDGLRVQSRTESKSKESPKRDWEDSTEECKLVLVVRTDLGMTKGMSLCPSFLAIADHILQVKSQPNVLTLHSHVTRIFSKIHPSHQHSVGGKDKAKQRLLCR